MHPTVSVVLPVYNCERYVASAVKSILSQTYPDFELIVIDDGSTDATPDVLAQFRDARVRLIRQANHGLAPALNRGISLASGRFIARQDADDIALPSRLERQVSYLESNPRCALLGTWTRIMVGEKLTRRGHKHPAGGAELKFLMLFDSRFVHSSVMLRKSALEEVGLYSTDPDRQPPEDFELWSRIARLFEAANLPEPLQIYREIPSSISRTRSQFIRERSMRICAENLGWVCGRSASDPHVRDVAASFHRLPHLLSPRLSRLEMRGVVIRCAESIVRGAAGDVCAARDRVIRDVCSVTNLNFFSSRLLRGARRLVGLARDAAG